ncbi:MAG: hypothetical protein HYY23_19950 [Verrucomicrobia bacterium]|nr:hypothetical protein [Verrucomicrobiota bacterium]
MARNVERPARSQALSLRALHCNGPNGSQAAVKFFKAILNPLSSIHLGCGFAALRSLRLVIVFVWWALIGFWLCAFAHASEAPRSFEQANKLYEESKFREAAKAYRALVQQGRASPALFFNLGNALFKSGEAGRAIICYRLAEQLSPRDPDIKANLRFARDNVGAGVAQRKSALGRFLGVLTPNELTILVTILTWVWFGLLTLKELRPALGLSMSVYTKVAAACFVVFGFWFAAVLNAQLGEVPSVVVANEAVVRYGPFDESQSFFTLRNGAELTVLDRKDNWFQVQDGAKRIGWLRANQVAPLVPQSALEGS